MKCQPLRKAVPASGQLAWSRKEEEKEEEEEEEGVVQSVCTHAHAEDHEAPDD